jgi:hypothetical protein
MLFQINELLRILNPLSEPLSSLFCKAQLRAVKDTEKSDLLREGAPRLQKRPRISGAKNKPMKVLLLACARETRHLRAVARAVAHA